MGTAKFFSEGLSDFTGEIENQKLLNSLKSLSAFLKAEVRLLTWDEKYIAISLTIPVERPPLGTFENIDIRSEELVLVRLNVVNYPDESPMVFPDRLDFPKNQLSH